MIYQHTRTIDWPPTSFDLLKKRQQNRMLSEVIVKKKIVYVQYGQYS